MRQILTTVGTLIEAGKSIVQNESRVYSFLEIRTDSGSIERINSAVVYNECERGLVVGDRIAMLHAYSPNGTSNAFPNTKGMSIVYAVANQASGRQFNDVEVLASIGDKLRAGSSIRRWIWGLTTAGGALFGLQGGILGLLLGGVIGGLVGSMSYLVGAGLSASVPLFATRDEVEPHVAKLAELLGARST